jgi:hypothetical protein
LLDGHVLLLLVMKDLRLDAEDSLTKLTDECELDLGVDLGVS